MASIQMTLHARVRGGWRVRLVGALLRFHVYIPGSFDWAARGLRLQYRVDGKGRWRDSGGSFHIS